MQIAVVLASGGGEAAPNWRRALTPSRPVKDPFPCREAWRPAPCGRAGASGPPLAAEFPGPPRAERTRPPLGTSAALTSHYVTYSFEVNI